MKRMLGVLGFSLLLLCSTVYAVNPTFKYFNNNGGINTKKQDFLIADNELSSATNVYPDGDAVRKRFGFSKLNSSTVTSEAVGSLGLYDFQLPSGVSQLVKVNANGKIMKMDSLDGVWDDITPPTTGNLTVTTSAAVDFITFVSTTGVTLCLIGNGTDEIHQWDGTSANASILTEAADLNAPELNYFVVFKNRLFGAGDPDQKNTVFYTVAEEADDWGNGGSISIDGNDGDVITGLVTMPYAGEDIFDKLVIFKKKAIYVLNADDATPTNWVVSKINSKVGCESHWSIQRIDNTILFLDDDGIYALQGTTVTQLSDRIDPIIRDLNASRFKNTQSVLNREYDQYWLSVSDGSATTNDLIVMYDYVYNSFWEFTGMNAGALAEVIDPNNSSIKVYFDDYLGFTNQAWTGTADEGVTISANFITKKYTFGAIEWLKRIRYFYVFANADGDFDLTTSYARDGQTTFTDKTVNLDAGSSLWGTFVWGTDAWGGEDFIRSRVNVTPSETNAWGVRLKFTNNELNETFRVYGWSFNVQPLQRDDY